MKSLSIVVPVYQVKPYLERCLQSILNQTFSDYEVILVDDGSTDGSQDICDCYADSYDNVTVIHKNNGGLSSARNAGLDAATGKWIMFVDSDDMIHPQSAELQISLLEEKNADAVVCPLKRFVNECDIKSFSDIVELENISIKTGQEVEELFFNNPKANQFVSSCGKVFRRSLFCGIRFPEGRLFEDEYTTYKVYWECRSVIIVDVPLYYYYINSSGITQTLNLNKRFDEYDAQEERITFFQKKGAIMLYHLALKEFLRTAQWDLIDCQKKKQPYDPKLGERFQLQYREALKKAETEKIISFIENYDYYVLAYPRMRDVLRLKRKLLLLFRG